MNSTRTKDRLPTGSRLRTVLVIGLVSVWSVTLMSTAPADQNTPGDRGRTVFISKGCASCHAVYGHGVGGTDPSGGPDLGKRKVYGTYLELAANLWNHLPDMLRQMDRRGVEPPEFTTDEVDQIVQYLSFIRYMDQPGNERTGRRLLDRKKCTQCHGLIGDETGLAPNLGKSDGYTSPLDLATALWNHGPEMEAVFEEQDIDRPTLSGRDIVDLAAAIRSFITTSSVPPEAYDPGDPEVGEALALEKGCLSCHSVRQAGGDMAPDFAELDLDKTVTEIAGDMWNHGPDMWDLARDRGMNVPTLDRTEMASLIAYLYSLSLEDEAGDPEAGASVVDDKRCTACHAVSSAGGDLAGDLTESDGFDSPTAMIAAMWNHAADMAEYGRERRVKWPRLSGDDIADIYAFVRSH